MTDRFLDIAFAAIIFLGLLAAASMVLVIAVTAVRMVFG